MRKFTFFVGISKPTLTAEWTPDVYSFNNIDAEQELTTYLSQEIARTIDTQIMDDLIREITGERRA
jgi:hypothetical protein